jgi:hypothetical protein
MNNNNKHRGIVVVVAMIAAASLLTLGAVAVPILAPALADSDDGNTEKNIDELIIINKDDKPLTQGGLLQLLTEQPIESGTPLEQPTVGFSAPSLP